MRIVAAIGGSIIIKGYDYKKFHKYAEILRELSKEHEIFVIIGGGQPAREYIKVARDLGCGEAKCDDLGIELTRINAKLLILL
jgi:uridylate kinase